MREETILVIDDDENLRETVKIMLEVFGGYKVVTAFDGKEGIKQAHMVKPDLILLDIKMPEMDGMQTLKILKEAAATVGIPVVMLTACGEDILKMKATQLYDEDYIIKPIEARELVARIEKVLERRKMK